MKDFLSMEKPKDEEGWFILKEISTRGNGITIRFMGTGYSKFIKEVDTKACGKTISRMAREKKNGQMVHLTKDLTKMA